MAVASRGRRAVSATRTPHAAHQRPPPDALPALPALALLLGPLEGMRWQLLGWSHDAGGDTEAAQVPPTRYVAALLVYVRPCAALLSERYGGGLLAAAVPSCLFGKMLERRVYETALVGALPAG